MNARKLRRADPRQPSLWDVAARQPAQQSPGHQPSVTSHAAAKAMRPRGRELRDKVLEELRRAPGTADEIAERIGESVLAVRPRLTELKGSDNPPRPKLIEATGERRANESGMSAHVWRAIG